MDYGVDFWWNLATPQSIPRSYAVNQEMGCLNCGKAIDVYGNYPYTADVVNEPWKLECPNCHMKFPTNDFEAYYKSGINEYGVFDPSKADKSLLINTLYPERGSKWGVDDGYGYKHTNGKRYTFVAYYNHWMLWYTSGSYPYAEGIIKEAITAFRDAYIYTGDIKYARAGIILLDRIADLYPDMDTSAYSQNDGFLNSNGGNGQGKILGSIWETRLVKDFLSAYDAFLPEFDDEETIAFLNNKSLEYKMQGVKNNSDGIRKNIEDGIVRQIYPAFKKAQIRGNMGMHQSCLAMAAVVLDKNPEAKDWIDYTFKSGDYIKQPPNYYLTGGNVLALLVNDVDRDGHGNEASPGYNEGWISNINLVAEVLEGYDLYPGVDLYEHPKFRKMFYQNYPLTMINRYTSKIGDYGSTGKPEIVASLSNSMIAFEKFRDVLSAQFAYFMNNNSTEGLHGNVFSYDANNLGAEIENIINTYGPLDLKSVNLTGYGFGVLRDGELEKEKEQYIDTQREISLYYGRSDMHGHRDTLNLGIFAFGLDLSPDLAYPEYTGVWPHRQEWTENTISHNTVVVDKKKQEVNIVGVPHHFDSSERVKLIDVEAPSPYPQTDMYRRTVAMIKVDEANSYIVDFFRVKGGNDHNFSFHGAEGTVTTEGLNLIAQPTGTYAGPNIEYGQRYDSVEGANYMGSGFHWLYYVERDTDPSRIFSVDWSVTDTWNVHPEPRDIHLRITMIGDMNEVALADGQPPRNKPGNPENLRYLIAHRSGTNLSSLFTSVIEPYENQRFVDSISEVTLKVNGQVVDDIYAKAIKVVLENGRVDYIINSINPNVTYTVDDKFQFKGFFGVYFEENEVPSYGYLNDGAFLGDIITNARNYLSGTVINFTKEMSISNQIEVEMSTSDFDENDIVGKYIYIDPAGGCNAVYEIKGILERNDRFVTLDVGDVTLIEKWADANDFSKGYKYFIEEGANFKIPYSYEWK